jgi:LPXTG-site transpeptidase (sortase) family protein
MPGWTTRRPIWAVAAALVVAAGLGAGLLAAGLHPARPVAEAPAVASAIPVVAAPTASPTRDAWWKPLPIATSSFVPAQLVIQKLRVQAPIEAKGVDAHNVMESPDRAMDAAWYTFTARPGAGSNAVFAGYLDFGQLGNPAIFWHLDELGRGDLVEVVSPQRTEIRYRVTRTWDYFVQTMPMATVLATDRTDEVTLITCAGTFLNGLGYDHRFVIRAVRSA